MIFVYELTEATLRGLNVAVHAIRKILTPSRGFNFADGPFQNISQISRIDTAVLKTGG